MLQLVLHLAKTDFSTIFVETTPHSLFFPGGGANDYDTMQDWREKLGAAFNIDVPTDEEIKQAQNPVEEPAGDALAQQGKQMVNVLLDKKGRNGKKVTLVTDLLCDDEALKELAAELKRHCGVGGSARGGEILIQGDFREKVVQLLKQKGFKARTI